MFALYASITIYFHYSLSFVAEPDLILVGSSSGILKFFRGSNSRLLIFSFIRLNSFIESQN